MSQEIVNWYQERVEAYLADPQAAQTKYHLPLELLLEILKENLNLKKETEPGAILQGAQEILSRLADGEILAQNVPDPESLRWWQEELEKAEARKREIKEKVIQEIRAKIQKRQAMWAKIRKALVETGDPALSEEPETTRALALEIEESLTEQILQEPQELNEEAYQDQVAAFGPEFDQKLREKGIFLPPGVLQTLLDKIAHETIEEAVNLARLEIPEEETLAGRVVPEKAPALVPLAGPSPKAAVIEPEKPLFTPMVQEKFNNEEEGVALAPLYTLLHPPAAISFLKKITLTPYVKSLQFLDRLAGEELAGETKVEWREKLHQGLSSQDLAESYQALLEAGVSPEQPQMKSLLLKEARMKHYEESHRTTSAILKHYHEFTKITGRRQFFLEEIKNPLPRLSPSPSWFNKMGKVSYSLRLKRTLDDLGSHFFYEKGLLPSGKTVTYFSLPDKIIRLASLGKIQTYEAVKSWASRKILKPVLTSLGKTALGQGIKRGAAAIITRLGLAAIPGLGTAAAAVLTIASPSTLKRIAKIAGAVIGGFFFLLGSLGTGAVAGGILGGITGAILGLPFGPLGVIGGFVIGVGLGIPLGIFVEKWLLPNAANFFSGLLAGAGEFFGGIATTASGFLSSLSAISIPTTIPMVAVVGGPAVAGILTTIVILNTSAAFLKEPSSLAPPAPVGSSYIEISKKAFYGGRETQIIRNEDLTENSTLAYAITITARTKDLINLTITDNTIATLKNASTNINTDTDGKSIGPWQSPSLKSGEMWEKSYTINIPKSRFENSLITNTIQVKAETVQSDGTKTNEEKSLSLSVAIGTPPFSLDSIVAWAKQIVDKLGTGLFDFFNKLLSVLSNGIYNTGVWDGATLNKLYWCTYLIIDAYRLAGVPGLDKNAHGLVTNMERFFANSSASGYKYIDYRKNPQGLGQIKPGYAMFMYKNFAYSSGDAHVVLVTSVNINGRGDGSFSAIQSNADNKTRTYSVSNWQITDSSFKIITGFGGI